MKCLVMPSLIRESNQPWCAWSRVDACWLRQETTCPHLPGLPRALLRAKVGHHEDVHKPPKARCGVSQGTCIFLEVPLLCDARYEGV